MMEWIYIGFTAMVAFFAFGWGIDDEDPNSFTKFLICAILNSPNFFQVFKRRKSWKEKRT